MAATGTQVPWTDPGGTPCCCDSCPTTENEPDATYSPGTWSNISEGDYNALLAGGTFTLDLSLSLSGTSDLFPEFVETATANHVDIPLVTRASIASALPCYNQLITTQTINSTHTLDGGTVLRPIAINFTYALAIVGGTRRLSLANAQTASGGGQNKYTTIIGSVAGTDMPLQTFITVTNPVFNEPKGVCTSIDNYIPEAKEVEASVSLVMPEATYSADNVVRVLYCYDNDITGTVQGTFDMIVRFSPSAP